MDGSPGCRVAGCRDPYGLECLELTDGWASSFVINSDPLDGRVTGLPGCRVVGLRYVVILADSNSPDERVAGCRLSKWTGRRAARVAGYRLS